jgi:hypothetical protein
MPKGIHVVSISSDGNHPSRIAPDLAIANEPDIANFEVFRPLAEGEPDPGQLPEEQIDVPMQSNPPSLVPSLVSSQVEVVTEKHNAGCAGHACATCTKIWHHDYDCSAREQKPALCPECCAQSAVEINRSQTIEQIAQLSSQNLTGRETIECMLEHEQFVVHELIYDPKTKVEYPDWMERVNNHRRDIARNIEKWKIRDLATSKAVMRKHAEDVSKLTPEEVEQYKRDARRSKTASSAPEKKDKTAKAPKQLDAKTAYDKMLKGLMTEIKSKRKAKGLADLDDDAVIAQAEKKYKMMNEEEE